MKKNITIIIFIFLISILLNCFFYNSNADTTFEDSVGDSSATDMDTIISQGDSFLKKGKEAKNGGEKIETIAGNTFSEAVKGIYNILLVIAVAVSVIIAAIMGIKIMIGSAEEKAEIKEQMIPYIIGCAVMFGAFSIWKIIMVIAGNLT